MIIWLIVKPFNCVKNKICSSLFKNFIYKICLEIMYLIYMFKRYLTLNDIQWLICHQTKPVSHNGFKKSLLWMLLFQCFCHFLWRNLLILSVESIDGILNLSGAKLRANLATKSALSFPITPICPNIQHIWITELNIEYNLLRSLMIKVSSNFYSFVIPRQRASLEILLGFCYFFQRWCWAWGLLYNISWKDGVFFWKNCYNFLQDWSLTIRCNLMSYLGH